MKLTTAPAPHIHSGSSTRRIMLDVAAALLPALLAGVLRFGIRALTVTLLCVCTAVLAEVLYCKLRGLPNSARDGSAVVTGLLLAMTLPHTVPLWMAALGSIFAVCAVKLLCGGLGENIFNPALSARALLMLLYPVGITRYADIDGVSTATPLHHMVMPSLPEQSLTDMFLGRTPGSIGEISALALLLGGAYLVFRGVISCRIPLSYLGSAAVLTLIFHKTDTPLLWMLYSLLSGGIMLGAIFMATDYTASPVTPRGQILYGIGCGTLTVLFRYWGLYPEGVTYAILLMNATVWLIDRYTAPRRFGCRSGKGGDRK